MVSNALQKIFFMVIYRETPILNKDVIMKIASFQKNITPEVGTPVAGYGPHDVSKTQLDELFVSGLCVDDGEGRILLMSFDLLGLDEWYIKELRKECAALLAIPESAVLLSCTHTHSGPNTRSLGAFPEILEKAYLEELKKTVLTALGEMKDFRECLAGYFSTSCDANTNRRITTADNHASFLPHCGEFRPLATGFADKELGVLFFMDKETREPLYLIGNYAAHPLAGHAPGLGGHRISADYPGAFRRYIKSETGIDSMFISGAAGDMVPKEDELGKDAIEFNGVKLAKAALASVVNLTRKFQRFQLEDKVGGKIGNFTASFRKNYSSGLRKLPLPYRNKQEVSLEVQCVSIGDVAFVGVPGELCAELGQEIKWHSPFRRTFIAYNSTACMSYICPGNFLVAGGYEGDTQEISARSSLKLVNTAVDTLYELREELFPSPEEKGEKYPDYLVSPLVSITVTAEGK